MTNYIGKIFGKFRRIIKKIELGGYLLTILSV